MYRSRLGNDLSDITLDYVSSIDDDFEISIYDIVGSQAHALMLYQQSIITKNDAKKTIKLNGLFFQHRDTEATEDVIHKINRRNAVGWAKPAIPFDRIKKVHRRRKGLRRLIVACPS